MNLGTRATHLEMAPTDEEGNVLVRTTVPFKVGVFDLAAARQGMNKLLEGLGGIGDDTSSASEVHRAAR